MKKFHFAKIPIYTFIKNIFSQKRHALGALILLIIILTSILFFVNRAPSPPLLKIVGFSDEKKTNLYNYLKSEESGYGPTLERVPPESEEQDTVPDLWIDYWNHHLEANEGQFSPFNLKSLGPMPTSIIRMTYFNEEIKAVPLALDHVELAFRPDFFTKEGLRVNDRIESLGDLEDVLFVVTRGRPLCFWKKSVFFRVSAFFTDF